MDAQKSVVHLVVRRENAPTAVPVLAPRNRLVKRINLLFIDSAMLEVIILLTVSMDDIYGYLLCKHVKEIISVSDCTVYGCIHRLCDEEYLDKYEKTENGRLHRYYTVTAQGKRYIVECRKDWKKHEVIVDSLLLEKYPTS